MGYAWIGFGVGTGSIGWKTEMGRNEITLGDGFFFKRVVGFLPDEAVQVVA